MSGHKSHTTETPRSCGEAWIKYYIDEDLSGGPHHNNWLDAAQAAFDAGWKAAMEAMKP